MKRFLTFLIICFGLTIIPVTAEDFDFSTVNDFWNIEHPDLDKEVKAVSDEEFEKAIEQVDSKVNKWKNRVERWKRPKGEAFSQGNETEEIQSETGEKATLPVISLPIALKIGDGILPVGHYQVKAELNEGKPVLKLFQAHYLMAKIPAIETNDDFNEEEILFVKWIPQGESRIKIIYGSLDLNAYAYADIVQSNEY